jgi:hypothetical protein
LSSAGPPRISCAMLASIVVSIFVPENPCAVGRRERELRSCSSLVLASLLWWWLRVRESSPTLFKRVQSACAG